MDSVSGLLTVILNGESGEAYNISDEASDIMLKDLAAIIADYAGRKVVFEIPDAVESAGYSKATKARLDSSKLNSLGWKAKYDIKTGIVRTIEMLKSNKLIVERSFMNLKETFKKQGGIKLLKQYWQGGALFTGIGQFLLLGKSRTALEILRLSTTLKTKQKLEKKYKWKLEEFDKTYTEKEHKTSDTIWICWFQGMDNAPDLVKKCYQSVVKNNPDKK